MSVLACTRSDHPVGPHYHYGYAGAHWSHDFPHWDMDATRKLYAKPGWLDAQTHPDMDYDKGWRS